mmetsp:Transcript_11776/g.23994  ORF Transcript_11776/g.23994 Transcript_11776/m.23994 type:complete len:148 (-) Transcript_11776:252-695(-)
MAFVSSVAVVRPGSKRCVCDVRMLADAPMTRRDLLAAGVAAAVAAVTAGGAARAEREYPGLPYLGGSDQIDINNANVRVYQKFPGMYPTLGGLLVKNGPFNSVSDIYKIPDLTEDDKAVLKKYEKNFLALPPSPDYVIDRINNGLYR